MKKRNVCVDIMQVQADIYIISPRTTINANNNVILGFFNVFEGFQGFSRVFKGVQGCSRVFKGFLGFSRFFKVFLRVFNGFQGFSRVLKSFQGFSGVFTNYQTPAKTKPAITKPTKVLEGFWHFSRFLNGSHGVASFFPKGFKGESLMFFNVLISRFLDVFKKKLRVLKWKAGLSLQFKIADMGNSES